MAKGQKLLSALNSGIPIGVKGSGFGPTSTSHYQIRLLAEFSSRVDGNPDTVGGSCLVLSASSTQGQRIQFSSSRYNFHFPVSWSSRTGTFCWLFLPPWPRSPWHLAVWEGWGGYDCEDEICSCILDVISVTFTVLAIAPITPSQPDTLMSNGPDVPLW